MQKFLQVSNAWSITFLKHISMHALAEAPQAYLKIDVTLLGSKTRINPVFHNAWIISDFEHRTSPTPTAALIRATQIPWPPQT